MYCMYCLFLFMTSLTFITYIYRFKLFLLCCHVSELFYDNKKISIQKDECFIFNHTDHSLVDISKKQYINNYTNDNNYLTIMEKNKHYVIYPNQLFENTTTPFIICEIVLNNKHYDITKYIKLFYVKNNIILTRPFIIYIFYKYYNIKILNVDTYTIKYIDNNLDIKTINSDNINIYKYTI